MVSYIQSGLQNSPKALGQQASAVKLLSGVAGFGGGAMVLTALLTAQAMLPLFLILGTILMVAARESFVMADNVEDMTLSKKQGVTDHLKSLGRSGVSATFSEGCADYVLKGTWFMGPIYNLCSGQQQDSE